MARILTTDIGGTNSRFAVFEGGEDGSLTCLKSVWLSTWGASSFENLLQKLDASDFGYRPSTCDITVAAVPGPVESGCFANLANVPWQVDLSGLKSDLGPGRVHLINDFVAQAFACRTSAVQHALLIKEGTGQPEAPLSVVGAGTGFGHCSLVPDGRGGFIPLPSEAGHTAFAFVTREEHDFERFVLDRTGREFVIGDDIISGRGLSYLHEFHHGIKLEPREVVAQTIPDSPVQHWFARLYGRACRNYALSMLSLGGFYIAGGVSSKNPHLLDNDDFRDEFVASAAHGKLLRRIPVRLVTNEESGLWGAAFYGVVTLARAHACARGKAD